MVSVRKVVDGVRQKQIAKLKVIEFTNSKADARHGLLPDGSSRPYTGYKGDSNYCIEIVRNEKGKWKGEVISTFDAYQLVRRYGLDRLKRPALSARENPIVMRLITGDYVKAEFKGTTRLLTVKKIKLNGSIFFAAHQEANIRQREDAKDGTLIYGSFTAGSLYKSKGRKVSVSPVGEVRDPGFKE
jgi:CRISPR-associated endonuclease Csn1